MNLERSSAPLLAVLGLLMLATQAWAVDVVTVYFYRHSQAATDDCGEDPCFEFEIEVSLDLAVTSVSARQTDIDLVLDLQYDAGEGNWNVTADELTADELSAGNGAWELTVDDGEPTESVYSFELDVDLSAGSFPAGLPEFTELTSSSVTWDSDGAASDPSVSSLFIDFYDESSGSEYVFVLPVAQLTFDPLDGGVAEGDYSVLVVYGSDGTGASALTHDSGATISWDLTTPRVQMSARTPAVPITIEEPPAGWADDSDGLPEIAAPTEAVAWVDYDADGDPDLHVVRSEGAGQLFRNDGGGTFVDVTAGPLSIATPEQAIAWGDYDNDGDPDLCLPGRTTGKLLRNDGGTFAAIEDAGIRTTASRHAAWVDHDGDGDLDLYLGNDSGCTQNLFSDDAGEFLPLDASNPVSHCDRSVAIMAWADYDDDGDSDLFVGQDGDDESPKLYRNEGAGVFVDATPVALGTASRLGGAAWGDYDNDGDLDLYLSLLAGANKLYRNEGAGVLVDVTVPPLGDTGPGGGVSWADYDNDGDLDLFLCNTDFVVDQNRLFENRGAGQFADVTPELLESNAPGQGKTVAWADYDGDGDLDLYIGNTKRADGPSATPDQLVRNELAGSNRWLHIDLVGTFSNRSAIGARVRATSDPLSQIREVTAGPGDGSQDSLTVEFGLGSHAVVDLLEIDWPSGVRQTLTNVATNQRITVVESVPELVAPASAATTLTTERPSQWFRVPTTAGQNLLLELSGAVAGAETELYARYRALPRPDAFDFAARAPARRDQRLVIAGTPDGDCFVLIRGVSIPGGSTSVQLRADVEEQSLSAIEPSAHASSGPVEVTILGGGFDTDSSFLLPGVTTVETNILSRSAARVTFDLRGATAGVYDLIVSAPGRGSATLVSAFEVLESAVGPQLDVYLGGRSTYRCRWTDTIELTWENLGDEEIPALLLRVDAPPEVGMRLEDEGPFQQGELLVLATNPPPLPAGKLSPGSRNRVTIEILQATGCTAPGELEFRVSRLVSGPDDIVDWSALDAPDGMSAEDWAAVRDPLASDLDATTWSDYERGLGDLATRLSDRLESTASAWRLFRLAVRDAAADRPSAAIAGTLLDSEFYTPLKDTLVLALEEGTVRSCARTDAGGYFLLDCLTAGTTYELVVDEHAPIVVQNVTVPDDRDLTGVELVVAWTGNGFEPACEPCAEGGLPTVSLFPPPSAFTEISRWTVDVVDSLDPNEKEGSPGPLEDGDTQGDDEIFPGQRLHYTVNFQNSGDANVHDVTIIDPLPDTLDLATFQPGVVKIGAGEENGSRTLSATPSYGASSTSSFGLAGATTVDTLSVMDDDPIPVHVGYELDLTTGVLIWTIRALEPETDPPRLLRDPVDGILSSDKVDEPRSQGYVTFSIVPKQDLPDDTPIDNDLFIHFDGGAPVTAGVSHRFVCCHAPEVPHHPVPADGAEDVEVRSELRWRSRRAESFDLYLGIGEEPLALVAPVDPVPGAASGLGVHRLEALPPETLVRWRVDSKDGAGATFASPIWSFRTRAGSGGFSRGDANGDTNLDLSDGVFILNYLFAGGAAPGCLDAADLDDRGDLNITDGIYVFNYLFAGGPPPVQPFPACGEDPTPDDSLDCLEFECADP